MIEAHKRRSTFAWYVVGTIPFLTLVAVHWQYGPLAALGDWAQYMLHADALLHGRSYSDIGYIFTSRNPYIGPPAQTPGLPAALVPLLALTGGAREAAAYKLLMVAFALAFLGCAFLYFERRSGRAIAVGTVMLLGLWLETGFVTNAVQPDVAFCAFVWAIFCLADRSEPWHLTHVVAVSILGAAALAFRAATLPLVPALGVYSWIHRRDIGLRPMIPVAVWCACELIAIAALPGAFLFGRLVVLDATRPTENVATAMHVVATAMHSVAAAMHNVAAATRVYPFAALDLFLYPFPWNVANDAYHISVAVLAVIGAIAWARKEWTQLLALFTVLYLGMLFVLPMHDGRYLMPLAPLALYTGVRGAAIAVRWISQRLHRSLSVDASQRVALVAAVGIAALAVVHEATLPAPTTLFDAPGVRSVFTFLRTEQVAGPVRAVFMNPRALTWETGVPAMGFFIASPDTTLAEFRKRRITHVVVGDLDTDPKHAPSIERAVAARPNAFRRLFSEGVFTVYAVDSTRAARP